MLLGPVLTNWPKRRRADCEDKSFVNFAIRNSQSEMQNAGLCLLLSLCFLLSSVLLFRN